MSSIFLAAILEGEVVFVGASVLVAKGYLHPAGVMVAGALGGAAGDNIWFHALRGRLERWLDRVRGSPPVTTSSWRG